MQHEINQSTGLSQRDQEALELGRRIQETYRRQEIANFLDRALFLIATHPHLEHSPMPSHLLIESMFSLKWMFLEPTKKEN